MAMGVHGSKDLVLDMTLSGPSVKPIHCFYLCLPLASLFLYYQKSESGNFQIKKVETFR
jgi:hypothetical protein